MLTASERSTGYAAAAPAEAQTYVTPKGYRGDGTVPGVVFCHPSIAAPHDTQPIDGTTPSLTALLLAVAREFPLVSAALGGDNWANDTGIARVADARAFLQARGAKAGKVALIGYSMGGALAYAYRRANPANVSCAVLLQPVSDIGDLHATDRSGATTVINAAYGARNDVCGTTSGSATVLDAAIGAGDANKQVRGTGIPAGSKVGAVTPGVSFQLASASTGNPVNATATGTPTLQVGGYVNATDGPTHNPESFKAQLAGLRAQVWYSTADALVLPANVLSVTTAIGGTAEVRSTTGAHGSEAAMAQVSATDVLAFLRTYAGAA